MRQNQNHYTLQVVGYHDTRDDPYPVHDLIEVFVQVRFPNNRQAEVLFSQGGLTDCYEVKK